MYSYLCGSQFVIFGDSLSFWDQVCHCGSQFVVVGASLSIHFDGLYFACCVDGVVHAPWSNVC